jgi:hypothetical protein
MRADTVIGSMTKRERHVLWHIAAIAGLSVLLVIAQVRKSDAQNAPPPAASIVPPSASPAEHGTPRWPPAPPVGLNAYLEWARWPYQRIGIRAYMRSTYDRNGLNRTADASHFLYGEGPDFNVTVDVLGPGILYFVRTNRWHGSPWHYEIDGVDHVLRETATADPEHLPPESKYDPPELFPPPLAWTWPTTKGSDLNWVPIPFDRSLRLAYGTNVLRHRVLHLSSIRR